MKSVTHPAQASSFHPHLPEVWVRFLVAIVGLALAFGAALFSTVSREAGNVWATAILASSALLLAVLVGLTTVPHLARRVASGARWQDAFDIEVTRAGVAYVVLTLLVAVAALNTGNNLLYIVVATMLASVLASGVVSTVNLRDLEVEASIPQHVFAQQPAVARLRVRNPRRWLAALSLRVLPPKTIKARMQWRAERSSFGFPPRRPAEQQWFRVPDYAYRRVAVRPPPALFEGNAYFPFVGPRCSSEAILQLNFPRRGHYAQEGLVVATGFPFGLLTKRRQLALAQELTVYPALAPWEEVAAHLPRTRGEWETFVRGQGAELYRIREHVPEDSARHVDWKATAKSGSLKVREFTREDDRRVHLIFDNPNPDEVPTADYERGVTLAASLAWFLAQPSVVQQSVQVTFAVGDHLATEDMHEFLRYLATIAPEAGASVPTVNDLEAATLVVTARPWGNFAASPHLRLIPFSLAARGAASTQS
jgi:uncharacterized protein (DUF58 family)